MINFLSSPCPLCDATHIQFYDHDKFREYLQCQTCQLVFVPKKFQLAEEKEKEIYDLHQNDPMDKGYRQFLSRLTVPLVQQLKPRAKGLDFGSGPGPTISIMLAEMGYDMAIYDKYYAPDTGVFHNQYDFITATEVIEHIAQPKHYLKKLFDCLYVGGILAIMTKRVINQSAFSQWHYKNDLTHVCFYSEASFRWIATNWQLELEFIDKDVVFLHKKEQHS